MFRPYWPSSGFYNIEEESIIAVKTVWGLLIKRSVHQSPDHSVPRAIAICKHGEKNCRQRKILSLVWRLGGVGGILPGAAKTLRPGLAVVLNLSLSLWGTSFVGDLGGFMCCCLCISLGPAVGIRVCPDRCIEVSL